jgi:hypothetical protein
VTGNRKEEGKKEGQKEMAPKFVEDLGPFQEKT